MTAADYILEGLEAELALERELGVRMVECDRELLSVSGGSSFRMSENGIPGVAGTPDNQTIKQSSNQTIFDFAFLHDRALSAGGVEMMAKIVTAMGKTAETAPIVFTGDYPQAKYFIVLGLDALKKWFPGKTAAPGQWITGDRGRQVFVTYSPEYVLRFGSVTSAVKKIKSEMWNGLKGVLARVKVESGRSDDGR